MKNLRAVFHFRVALVQAFLGGSFFAIEGLDLVQESLVGWGAFALLLALVHAAISSWASISSEG